MPGDDSDDLMNWIVAGVSGNAADANGEGADSSASLSPDLDAPSAVCGLSVGSLFEVVRAHEALRGRWRVVKIDRGPRGTPRVWARQPASTDYLPLTEPQIEDALQHGWLLIVRKRASSKAPPRPE